MLFIATLFYNAGILLYSVGVKFYALWNNKAKQFANGRQHWRTNIGSIIGNDTTQKIWVHCASVGEFEQGRNLIEALKKKYPKQKIVLTFFSPSGFLLRKNYQYADYVFYLPLDTQRNARDFIQYINPLFVVFIKYEFWYNFLAELKKQKIATILISGVFRSNQYFFKWYGATFGKKIITCFAHLFVQNGASKLLLQAIAQPESITIAGDTRYDRVLSIASEAQSLPLIEKFLNKSPALIAGSTWLNDEKVLQQILPQLPTNYKLIIAPHETDSHRINEVRALFPDAVLYSELPSAITMPNVLIVNNVGMLSSLYQYGRIAFVGGGFQRGGIHNILEPAVFNIPVLIGTNYKKFVEATSLINLQYCFSVGDATSANAIIAKLTNDIPYYKSIQAGLRKYMQTQQGATEKILHYLTKNIQP